MLFNQSYGPYFGNFGIFNNDKFYCYSNGGPFNVSNNSQGKHEITELGDGNYDFKDYEVFAISTQ